MADTKYSETYQAEQLLRLLENTDGLVFCPLSK